jgi:hypothetical protein
MLNEIFAWLDTQDPQTLLITAGVLLALGYPVSLKLHPWRKCLRCKGSPRNFGAIYTYAWRNCGRCGGSGRELRRGVRFTGIGRPKGT